MRFLIGAGRSDPLMKPFHLFSLILSFAVASVAAEVSSPAALGKGTLLASKGHAAMPVEIEADPDAL